MHRRREDVLICSLELGDFAASTNGHNNNINNKNEDIKFYGASDRSRNTTAVGA